MVAGRGVNDDAVGRRQAPRRRLRRGRLAPPDVLPASGRRPAGDGQRPPVRADARCRWRWLICNNGRYGNAWGAAWRVDEGPPHRSPALQCPGPCPPHRPAPGPGGGVRGGGGQRRRCATWCGTAPAARWAVPNDGGHVLRSPSWAPRARWPDHAPTGRPVTPSRGFRLRVPQV